MARREIEDSLGPWELRETLEMFLRRDRRVTLAHLACVDWTDVMELTDFLEIRELPESPDSGVPARRESAVTWVLLVWMEFLVFPVKREIGVSPANVDLRETREPLEFPVIL